MGFLVLEVLRVVEAPFLQDEPVPEYCFRQVAGSQWAGVVSHLRWC